MDGRKAIQDPVHGSISIGGVFLQVADRPEVQRLRGVRQLGLGYLVFPSAHHTRFEHSLGAYHLAGRMADSLGLSREDSDTVRMAGLLHDVCHPPFSHTLEPLMEEITGMDHMDLARALIHGKIGYIRPGDEDLFDGMDTIAEVLGDNGISADEVCDIISYPDSGRGALDRFTGVNDHFPSRDFIHQIIHGPVDVDQMDYLMRDAHFTGVSHGTIDSDRLIDTMAVHNDRIVLRRGGITAAEGLMVSRSLMYTTVYFHETTRIAQRMLSKAVEEVAGDIRDLHLMNDADLFQQLEAMGGNQRWTVRRLMNRQIDKKAFAVYSADMTDEIAERLLGYTDKGGRVRLEQEIADAAEMEV
ncbi:MAG: HD domain-containing protein, partial [Candidatus Methanomethylophilaceae archaeon]|nr:HD domain-containing protein [Candidatus Methanomethylophilaceae archaeon]